MTGAFTAIKLPIRKWAALDHGLVQHAWARRTITRTWVSRCGGFLLDADYPWHRVSTTKKCQKCQRAVARHIVNWEAIPSLVKGKTDATSVAEDTETGK